MLSISFSRGPSSFGVKATREQAKAAAHVTGAALKLGRFPFEHVELVGEMLVFHRSRPLVAYACSPPPQDRTAGARVRIGASVTPP